MVLSKFFTYILSYVSPLYSKKEQKQIDDFGYISIPPPKKEILENRDLIYIV